ncbi:hypothetical protein [Thiocystis violacea]|uniref:hypothetical protein n=1 Tax=Thiocystis violacea TaxID=13725 RepID=UPI001A92C11B|nr:hypothetical protein [Thiocystis violacea]
MMWRHWIQGHHIKNYKLFCVFIPTALSVRGNHTSSMPSSDLHPMPKRDPAEIFSDLAMDIPAFEAIIVDSALAPNGGLALKDFVRKHAETIQHHYDHVTGCHLTREVANQLARGLWGYCQRLQPDETLADPPRIGTNPRWPARPPRPAPTSRTGATHR